MIEVGMDQHKRFSAAAALDVETGEVAEERFEHDEPERITTFLRSFEEPVRVTLETTGNWYWLADLVEEAGATLQLCHTVEAKRRYRGRAKTDRLDALALAELSAENRVPQAYVPAREGRDRRERHRFRIRLIRLQTALKNWMHALLSKLNIEGTEEARSEKQNSLKIIPDAFAGNLCPSAPICESFSRFRRKGSKFLSGANVKYFHRQSRKRFLKYWV